MKIIINQISKRYIIYIDGELVPIKDATKKCNVLMQQFRKILNFNNRELKVQEWLLKVEHGLHPSCKTFWKSGVPMWSKLVIKMTGVSDATAHRRIKQWMLDGDMDELMKPGNITVRQVPVNTTPEPVTLSIPIKSITVPLPEPVYVRDEPKPDNWGSLSSKSRRHNLKDIPCNGICDS